MAIAAAKQFQPFRVPTTHSQSTAMEPSATNMTGLANTAASQSFQAGASRPGFHWQTNELTAAAATNASTIRMANCAFGRSAPTAPLTATAPIR